MKTILLFLALGLNLYAGISLGDKAPNFTLKSIDDTTTYTLKQFKGNVVILNLWTSWCKGCKKEMPAFFKFQKEYKNSNVKIIAINLDDNTQKAKKFLHSIETKLGYKTPFIVLQNPNKSVAKAYQCGAMPSTYIIDKNGNIQDLIVGSLNDDDIKQLKVEINKLK